MRVTALAPNQTAVLRVTDLGTGAYRETSFAIAQSNGNDASLLHAARHRSPSPGRGSTNARSGASSGRLHLRRHAALHRVQAPGRAVLGYPDDWWRRAAASSSRLPWRRPSARASRRYRRGDGRHRAARSRSRSPTSRGPSAPAPSTVSPGSLTLHARHLTDVSALVTIIGGLGTLPPADLHTSTVHRHHHGQYGHHPAPEPVRGAAHQPAPRSWLATACRRRSSRSRCTAGPL